MNDKELLYTHIGQVLTSNRFISTSNNYWTLEEEQRQPDQQISINGQVQVISGKSTIIRKSIKVEGEGDVSGHEFAQLSFTVEIQDKPDQWKEVETGIPEECIYFDDTGSFDYWVSYL